MGPKESESYSTQVAKRNYGRTKNKRYFPSFQLTCIKFTQNSPQWQIEDIHITRKQVLPANPITNREIIKPVMHSTFPALKLYNLQLVASIEPINLALPQIR